MSLNIFMFVEPNRITCGTCQQICSSAWSLIQHVQEKHGVKLCQEGSSSLSSTTTSTSSSAVDHTGTGSGSAQQQQPSQWRTSTNNGSPNSGREGSPGSSRGNNNRSSPFLSGGATSSIGGNSVRAPSPSPILGSTLLGVSPSISNHLHQLASVSAGATVPTSSILSGSLSREERGVTATSSITNSRSSSRHHSSHRDRDARSVSRESSRERSSSNSSAAASAAAAQLLAGQPGGFSLSGAAAAVAAAAAATSNGRNPLAPVHPFSPEGLGLLRFPFPQPFCMPTARPPSSSSSAASHDFRAVEQLVNNPAAAAAAVAAFGGGNNSGNPSNNGSSMTR